jgi:2-methylisocitrate lyase-like PEP mutase family enzyme
MTEPSLGINRRFRQRLVAGAGLLLPGTANALGARVIAASGFEAVYVTGAGIANTYLGVPDMGLVSVTELSEHVAAIRETVELPLVVDGDTGFGNALNMRRTIRLLERAGASAVQIEDQVFPKRCGHFSGKEVIPAAEMVQKIKAAVDARHDPDLLIIARTDSRAVEGFEAAIARAAAYREAGADVLFVEAPTSEAELAAIPAQLPGPQIANIVFGGKTPELPRERLAEMGFAGIIYANAALQAAVAGMSRVLTHLARTGSLAGVEDALASFATRQALVDYDAFQALEKRYSVHTRNEK